MRALVFETSLSFQPRRPEPAPEGGDALLKVRQAGICSTDLEIVKGYQNFHGILGHEFVADVVSADKKELVGQRVVGEINVVCGRCDLCLSGLSSHCRVRTVMGIQKRDGAFADYVRLPSGNLHVLPASVDDDTAIFVEPLAAALQIPKQIKLDGKSESQRGRKWVTVLGDGKLGLLVAQVLRNANCPVRVIGTHPDKLALCEKWQIRSRALADILPRHDQDVVVDCTGSAAGFELAMQMVRPRGTIVLKSTVAASKTMNLAPLVIDEITVIGSRCGPFRDAIRTLAEKQVDVASLIHRRMRLEQGVEAFDLAARPGVLKVLLTMEQERPVAKDLAIVLNNGSVNSAVVTAMSAQRFRPVMVYADITTEPASRARAAFDQQVAHFKPYREYSVPMAIPVDATSQTPAIVSDPRQVTPLAPQLTDLLPIVAVGLRFAAFHQAAAIYIGVRAGPSTDELAQATEYFQIWNELCQLPCGMAETEIYTPLLELEAWQVVDVGFQVSAPFERTWSCTEESSEPCWACRGCRAREAAFQQAGKPEPLRLGKKV